MPEVCPPRQAARNASTVRVHCYRRTGVLSRVGVESRWLRPPAPPMESFDRVVGAGANVGPTDRVSASVVNATRRSASAVARTVSTARPRRTAIDEPPRGLFTRRSLCNGSARSASDGHEHDPSRHRSCPRGLAIDELARSAAGSRRRATTGSPREAGPAERKASRPGVWVRRECAPGAATWRVGAAVVDGRRADRGDGAVYVGLRSRAVCRGVRARHAEGAGGRRADGVDEVDRISARGDAPRHVQARGRVRAGRRCGGFQRSSDQRCDRRRLRRADRIAARTGSTVVAISPAPARSARRSRGSASSPTDARCNSSHAAGSGGAR